MQYMKENLARIVREARMGLGLSQEKLAEILGFDSRTILNIEAGRGNPKFDNLCSLITYLNLSADDIFYPSSTGENQSIQKLVMAGLTQRKRKERRKRYKINISTAAYTVC